MVVSSDENALHRNTNNAVLRISDLYDLSTQCSNTAGVDLKQRETQDKQQIHSDTSNTKCYKYGTRTRQIQTINRQF